jgi:hypothetical protein
VSDVECREAVRQLSDLRWIRAEHLADGYDVSEFAGACYRDHCCTKLCPMQCLEELVHTPTVKDILVKYMDSMMLVL